MEWDESQPCDVEKTIQTQNKHNDTTLVPSVTVTAQGMFYGAKYINAHPVLLPCVVDGHSRNPLDNYYYTHHTFTPVINKLQQQLGGSGRVVNSL